MATSTRLPLYVRVTYEYNAVVAALSFKLFIIRDYFAALTTLQHPKTSLIVFYAMEFGKRRARTGLASISAQSLNMDQVHGGLVSPFSILQFFVLFGYFRV
ncbi:hypothetical protein DL96DRAFT_1562701 [Flagelloscypha sp. PMI_526]|nr:hypothetical protein DL96DRAFT_1562701 [Flagelloscypha sp. PMI_526]